MKPMTLKLLGLPGTGHSMSFEQICLVWFLQDAMGWAGISHTYTFLYSA